MSLLGVSVQRYARPEIVARVPAGAFYPAPKVESAILRLVPLPSAPSAADSQDFFTVVRSGFGLKRKQLVNSLSAGLDISKDETRRLLASAGITPSRRAESLSLEEWEGLTRAWRDLDEKRAADAPVSPRA
jgi:16S rRNA (adenine1518-N6/adenine1519-N6)-dimethyltransferase